MGRLAWSIWAAALAVDILALGFQARYAEDLARCAAGDRLALCAGFLAGWLLPVTVVIGLVLVAIGAWRILARKG